MKKIDLFFKDLRRSSSLQTVLWHTSCQSKTPFAATERAEALGARVQKLTCTSERSRGMSQGKHKQAEDK